CSSTSLGVSAMDSGIGMGGDVGTAKVTAGRLCPRAISRPQRRQQYLRRPGISGSFSNRALRPVFFGGGEEFVVLLEDRLSPKWHMVLAEETVTEDRLGSGGIDGGEKMFQRLGLSSASVEMVASPVLEVDGIGRAMREG